MDDASERAIEEDMLDQFNYFDDEDEELIDRREPGRLIPLIWSMKRLMRLRANQRSLHSLRALTRCFREPPCTTAFVPARSI
ncbi:MAG: hypothetical protein ACLU0O_04855 [Collinsella sp.]